MVYLNQKYKNLIREAYYLAGECLTSAGVFRPNQGALILCYHRVLPDNIFIDEINPTAGLIVRMSEFERQVQFLSEYFQIVPLGDVANFSKSNLGRPAVSITFDDGYSDYLPYVLPILERWQAPATMYITTSFPDGKPLMWWRDIWDIINHSQFIKCKINGVTKEFSLNNDDVRLRCYKELHAIALKLPPDELRAWLLEICEKNFKFKNYNRDAISWSDIEKLEQSELISIGAHTHNHVNLAVLSDHEAKNEIKYSKFLLEEHLGRAVKTFAYPYGRREHAGAREFEMVKDIGFDNAVTTVCNLQRDSDFRFSMPRVCVNRKASLKNFKLGVSGWSALTKVPII